MGNRLLGARQESREDQLQHELAVLRGRLSTAERGWKREYEWRRTMEDRIRRAVNDGFGGTPHEFLMALYRLVPKTPRKKFGRR